MAESLLVERLGRARALVLDELLPALGLRLEEKQRRNAANLWMCRRRVRCSGSVSVGLVLDCCSRGIGQAEKGRDEREERDEKDERGECT